MADPVTNIIEETLKKEPAQSHQLVYNSSSETLEPIYFWTLDMMNNFFGGKVEKLVDNFTSSPGSGHFSELGMKRSTMQKSVMDTLGAINQVIKSIINLIYDLKEFEIRLKHYEDADSEDKKTSEAGNLALKEIWMNTVDMKRGAGSINSLSAGNLNFVTLRDSFMSVNSLKDVEKVDVNDRVKRILESRISEFLAWRERSKKELQTRFEVQKNYLKSQVNTLQLYSRWIKPYLKSATDLEMKEAGTDPELVKTFNTIILELTLFGKNKFKVKEAIDTGKLPKKLKEPKRDYYSIVVVDFRFRGIPQKAGQHYLFGGKATVNFKAYALNEEELKIFEKEMKKSDVEDALKLTQGTTESLDALKEDIEYFLKEDTIVKKHEHKEEKSEDINPFSALFSPLFKKKNKDKNKKQDDKEIKLKDIKKDSYEEKLIRELAAENARETCYTIFDVYKKAHGMASHDSPFG